MTIPTFGAEKGHPVLKDLMNYYHSHSFVMSNGELDLTTINVVTKNVLVDNYSLQMNGQTQLLSHGIKVYAKEYFFSTDWETGVITKNPNLYIIHYADASWLTEEQKKSCKN